MINSDRIYKSEEVKLDKIVQFSEGNVYLYDVLKYCYDNGIKTFACCRGHESSEKTNWCHILPYISFIVDGVNDDRLLYTINNIIKDNRFSFDLSHLENRGTVLSISSFDIGEESIEIFFKMILLYLKKYSYDNCILL